MNSSTVVPTPGGSQVDAEAPNGDPRPAPSAGDAAIHLTQSPARGRSVLRDGYLWLTVLLSLLAAGPLMQPGYFWGAHDARHQVYFLFEFNRAIQDGIWYPRWAPDFTFGYGYPFFNIYGPLAFYVGEFFHLVGFDFVDATKIVFGLAVVLSGVAMYLFVKRLMGPRAALVAGLMYVFVPYHLADIYVRAALSETFGLIFVPLVLWGLYETVCFPRLNAVIGAGLAFAALVLSTQLLTMLAAPLLAAFALILIVGRVRQERRSRQAAALSYELANLVHIALPPLAGLLLGLGLSAIFWLPMLAEYKYVRVDQWAGGYYDYREHFVDFFQLFSPQWGFGTSVPGPHDATPFQLGAVPICLACLSLYLRRHMASPTVRWLTVFFLAVVVALIFLMLAPSTPLWDAFNLVRFAQFPWRLLVLAVPALSFLAGTVAATRPPARARPDLGLALLVLLILVGSYSYIRAEIVEPAEGPVGLAGLMRFQQSAGEMTGSTAWVQEIPKWSAIADHYIAGKEVDSKIDFTASQETLEAVPVEVGTFYELVRFKPFADPARLVFDIFYYPGWHAYLMQKNDKDYSIKRELKIEPYGKLGKISVQVTGDRRHVLVRFEDTPVRKAGQILSGLSLAAILLLVGGRAALRWRHGPR